MTTSNNHNNTKISSNKHVSGHVPTEKKMRLIGFTDTQQVTVCFSYYFVFFAFALTGITVHAHMNGHEPFVVAWYICLCS